MRINFEFRAWQEMLLTFRETGTVHKTEPDIIVLPISVKEIVQLSLLLQTRSDVGILKSQVINMLVLMQKILLL